MKHVEVEYIESGAFQGSEEDVGRAGIKYGEECLVVKTADLNAIHQTLSDLLALARIKYGNLDHDANAVFSAAEKFFKRRK